MIQCCQLNTCTLEFLWLSLMPWFVWTMAAHDGSVRGVAVDGLNQRAITGGADCLIKFWKFKSKELIGCLRMSTQVSSTVLHRERSVRTSKGAQMHGLRLSMNYHIKINLISNPVDLCTCMYLDLWKTCSLHAVIFTGLQLSEVWDS